MLQKLKRLWHMSQVNVDITELNSKEMTGMSITDKLRIIMCTQENFTNTFTWLIDLHVAKQTKGKAISFKFNV